MKEYGERTAAPAIDDAATVIADEATILTGVNAVTSAAAEIMGKYRDKFIKEAKTIARLDHPGIVRIHDVFEENGTAYYVMDYIEGENLNDLVKREGALPEARALGYIRQVADALSYVHGKSIMHLDVKPSNILVRESDDKPILIDFGTAKQYDASGTQTSTTPIGLSVGYAPIELMEVGGVKTFSPETDVYSLGATLYYLVTGKNPPGASERMEMIMEGEKFKLPDTISSATVDVIEQSMQARKKRIPNVNGFLALLNSDSENNRLEVEEKAAKEAEAKRQEELRIEQEKAEAEKKRIAEEKAKKEAEIQRQKQEKAEAEKKRIAEEKEKKQKTIWLALGGFFAVACIVSLIAILNRPSYSYSSNTNNDSALVTQEDLPISNEAVPAEEFAPAEEVPVQLTADDLISHSGKKNGHKWVDLGLSVKWATCNVGASSPGDYGNFVSWDHAFDAVRDKWGRSWRMPTIEEFKELKSKCTWTWTTQEGHTGYKITGRHGESIFLPASGSYEGGMNGHGYYWSSSLYSGGHDYAWYLYFSSSDILVYHLLHSEAFSVRPVTE